MGLTGLGTTSSVGAVDITSSPIIIPTGVSATSVVGSISPTAMMWVNWIISTTSSVGAITPTK